MALSDSMFLFEITIKDLKTYKRCNELIVTAEFADVFKICFKNPILNSASKKVRQMKVREKYKVRMSDIRSKNRILDVKSLNIHSILAAKTPSFLISHIKEHPLEISVFSKTSPSYKLGFSLIPWSKCFGNYVRNIHKNKGNSLVHAQGTYNIYGEMNMKRVATIDMSIKLLYLGEKLSNQLRSRSSDIPNTSMYTQIGSKPLSIRSTHKYSESKRLHANCIFTNNKHQLLKNTIDKDRTIKGDSNECLKRILNTKSDSNIVSSNRKIIKKSLSFSSIYCNRNNILRYIFGDLQGSYGNKLYYVGYFTVEKDNTDTESPKVSEVESSHQSSASRKKFKFKRCDSECQGKSHTSESAYSLDLSEGAAQISVTKCKEVDCNDRAHRKLPPPPDDRVLLDISNITKDCCINEQITEKVVGGVTTKMQIGEDPCFCTCECTFGFMKKTTYCTVCGGYEVAGEELTRKPAIEMPIPCPFFHKLVDKSKLKTWSTSGSESKKKGEDSKSMKVGSFQKAAASDKRLIVSEKKSVESEKDSKKGKKKKRDDRFKFNYGYKAPQIGHSRCVLPCSGTLDNVPKNMGWLWTAENIPGMKVHQGWKPGAVSKKLLRILKKAKSRKSKVEAIKPMRRFKKQVEDKPTLIVCKRSGTYHIEMQATNSKEDSNGPYKPLLYKIESTNNKAKIRKKEMLQKRLIRDAVKEIWSDPYHPELCEEICLKSYEEAIGVFPKEECEDEERTCDISCYEEDDISVSSSEIDWEIHFTPPLMCYQASQQGKLKSMVV